MKSADTTHDTTQQQKWGHSVLLKDFLFLGPPLARIVYSLLLRPLAAAGDLLIQPLKRSLSAAMSSGAGDRPLFNVVFVLGGPGSGKGTQCARISEQFKWAHLSAGDLLRAERAKGSDLGEQIDHHIKNGTIVPVEVTCSLLENAMVANKSTNNFLIDGFPRNQDNLEGWQRQMSTKTDVKFTLFFDCTEEICTQRCLQRGMAGSGRTDDNIESLRKRFVTNAESTMPIVKHFEAKGLLRTIDASQSPDQVYDIVKTLFEHIR